jgi:hypothetical protein
MQCACAMLSSVACPFVQHFFPILSHKWQGFVKKLLNIKCVFRFYLQLWPERFLILLRNERVLIKTVHRSSCTVFCVLVVFWRDLNFRYRFSKNSRMSDFLKAVRWEPSCSVRTDGQTDGQTWRSYSRFSQFCQLAKKNELKISRREVVVD